MADNIALKDRVLDDKLAKDMIGRESPNDLIIAKMNVSRIGSLTDAGEIVRKLNIAFNRIANGTLDGLDQLPQLRTLLAFCCGLQSVGYFTNKNNKLETLHLHQNQLTKIDEKYEYPIVGMICL